MRFEIGKGGVAAIALGTILLSTCVFVFGVAVGWDIGSQSERSAAQMSTAYPLAQAPAQPQPPPAAAAIAGSPTNNDTVAAASSQPAKVSARPSAPSAPVSSGEAGAESPARVANASPPPTGGQPSDHEDTAETAPPAQTAMAERPAGPRAHRKPFNIQIEAAMDLSGANQMMQRLQRLGYQSHLAPTNIGGESWYKVEVGPYATQEEAAAAEAALRAKYDAAYGGGTRPEQAAGTDSE